MNNIEIDKNTNTLKYTEKVKKRKQKEKEENDMMSSSQNFYKGFDKITEEVIGQDVIKNNIKPKIFSSIMSMKLDIKEKPTIMFFAGNSRTGKTLLGKKIGNIVGGDYLLIPMGNFKDKWSIGTLLGATAGLKGYDDKLMLEQYMSNNITGRYTLIFDEIEKADSSLESFFLELLDEGKVTLLNGKVLDFKNSIIIFTSNLGIEKSNKSIGFDLDKKLRDNLTVSENIIKSIKDFFSIEFFNRIGGSNGIYVFNNLSEKDYKKILENKVINNIKKIAEKLNNKIIINIDDVYKKIIKKINNITQENISNLSCEIEHQIILELYKS